MSLYQKYRPKTLGEMIGQETAVRQLSKMADSKSLSHAILMTGPSGCGKTTAARIVAGLAGAGATGIVEINCALTNGVDAIREIESRMHLKPLGGISKVYILDEFHSVTPAGQRGMLKLLEDTPSHLYFILCTTNPEKLEKPVVTRCVNVRFDNLALRDLKKLLEKVVQSEKVDATHLPDLSLIAKAADGSARKALVLLEQILSTREPSDWYAILDSFAEDSELFDLVRRLYSGCFASNDLLKWGPKLKEMPESGIEGLRMSIMSYGASILCSGKNVKDLETIIEIMDGFKEPFFSSKKPGFILQLAKLTK